MSSTFEALFGFERISLYIWGCSSVGRAPALQAGGQEFESPYLHLIIQKALNYQMEKTLGIYSQKSFSFDKRIFFEYP